MVKNIDNPMIILYNRYVNSTGLLRAYFTNEMPFKNIREWLHSGDKTIWESNIHEHNRYRRPPQGVSTKDWVLNLLRLKYEYIEHKDRDE